MTFYVPGLMFGAGVAIFLFYEFNRKQHARKDERRESLHDTRQQYLQRMIELKRKQDAGKQPPAGEAPAEEAPAGGSGTDGGQVGG
jgi:hypothetical protein